MKHRVFCNIVIDFIFFQASTVVSSRNILFWTVRVDFGYMHVCADNLGPLRPLIQGNMVILIRGLVPKFLSYTNSAQYTIQVQWCSRNSKSHFARNLLANRRTNLTLIVRLGTKMTC